MVVSRCTRLRYRGRDGHVLGVSGARCRVLWKARRLCPECPCPEGMSGPSSDPEVRAHSHFCRMVRHRGCLSRQITRSSAIRGHAARLGASFQTGITARILMSKRPVGLSPRPKPPCAAHHASVSSSFPGKRLALICRHWSCYSWLARRVTCFTHWRASHA